jgi:hypothetical protein
MKSIVRYCILFIFIIISHNHVFSQVIGIRAGAGYSRFIDDYERDMDKKTVYYGGIYYRHGLLTPIQVELNYEQKGVKLKVNDKKILMDFEYVTLPVLFSVDMFFLYLNAGPYCGLMTKANFNGLDVKADFKTFDWGIVYGGGVRLPVSHRIWLELDGRVNHGLFRIDATENFSNVRNKSWGLSFGLIYTFRT